MNSRPGGSGASFARWAGDTLANFLPHGVALAGAAAGAAAARRRWGLAGALAPLVAAGAAYAARTERLHAPPARRASSAGVLRVATVNVLRTNPQREPLQRFIEREQPDVLVLQEFAPAWLDVFDRIDGRYPHRVRHEASQVQVLSRLPLANVAFHVVPGAWQRVAVVSLDAGEGTEAFRLIALHGLLPVSPGRLAHRNSQFRIVEDLARGAERVVVAGDFNATLLSAGLARLVRDAGLRPASPPRGSRGTWPSHAPRLGVSLDHLLVRGFAPLEVRTAPSVGSDHLPLIADLAPEA